MARLRLEDQLCFALYAAAQAVAKAYDPRLRALGISYREYLALMVMWPTGRATAQQVADRLFMDPCTVDSMLHELMQGGFLTLQTQTTDPACLVATLTPVGIAMEPMASTARQVVACETFSDPGDYEELRDDLFALVTRITASPIG